MHVSSPSEQIKQVTFAHSSAITTALSFVLINSLVWLALNESDADADNAFVYEARVDGVAKATSEAWAIGQAVYWDNTNSRFTTTSTSNTLAGHAAAVAASADTTGDILFDTFA